MLVKAILVGLVLGLCKSEWIYGFPQVGRPIVVSTLTGLFLGDPVQGVIMGSVLELMQGVFRFFLHVFDKIQNVVFSV